MPDPRHPCGLHPDPVLELDPPAWEQFEFSSSVAIGWFDTHLKTAVKR
ncbi:hypothetical protein ABT009_32650 [Streptomyces sp. NPDC002896]